MLLIILFAVLCLAFANGANDNFKGVATLLGGGTASYRRALGWATVTTFCGSLAAVVLAPELLKAFRGDGFVAESLTADPRYVVAVALGAGLTVLLATRIGMPISTTHSLVGALVGAGLAADTSIRWSSLGGGYFLPMLFSPLLAIGSTAALYPLLQATRRILKVEEETCLCVGNEVVEVLPALDEAVVVTRLQRLTASVDDVVTCQRRYSGRVLGLEAAVTLDWLHYLSSGLVSFARGLNDTPKIAALLLVAPAVGDFIGISLVAVVIAGGGLLGARRVAETLSQKVTAMNHGQGFTANLVTGLIVVGASRLGMPVSTTHVSCGSLFGMGAITWQARWGMIGQILLAWVATLPVAALAGALCFQIAGQF